MMKTLITCKTSLDSQTLIDWIPTKELLNLSLSQRKLLHIDHLEIWRKEKTLTIWKKLNIQEILNSQTIGDKSLTPPQIRTE